MLINDLNTGIIVVRQFAIPSQPYRLSFFTDVLSEDENERAGSFVREQNRWQFVFCRGILRFLLGRYSEKNPKDIFFSYSASGKPCLSGKLEASFLKFNLSHTEDYLLIACAKEIEIGVDVEKIRPIPNFLQIMKQYYSKEENSYVLNLSKEEQQEAFFYCWTRKEALLKGLGVGIGEGLKMIQRRSCLERYLKMYTSDSLTGWSIDTLASPASYKIGLAYQGSGLSIENRMESWENYL